MPNRHATLTSLFTDIAEAIREKTGSNESIVADNFDLAIEAIPQGGGTQPQLYQPIITEGRNLITWTHNTNNGAFGTPVGKIDNVSVTSPLEITEELDNKILTIYETETNFQDSTPITITLHYVSFGSIMFTVSGQGSSTNRYISINGTKYINATTEPIEISSVETFVGTIISGGPEVKIIANGTVLATGPSGFINNADLSSYVGTSFVRNFNISYETANQIKITDIANKF